MKYIFYVIGILLLTLGISLTIHSDLGTSPFDAVLVVLSMNVGLTVGSWEDYTSHLSDWLQFKFKKTKIGSIGIGNSRYNVIVIDLWIFLLGSLMTPELWHSKAVCFGIGLFVIG